MNESSRSISRANEEEKRGILKTTMTSYPMPGLRIHNKSGSKPSM
jgi:hypothetical protein